jgi:hypothetical protein
MPEAKVLPLIPRRMPVEALQEAQDEPDLPPCKATLETLVNVVELPAHVRLRYALLLLEIERQAHDPNILVYRIPPMPELG